MESLRRLMPKLTMQLRKGDMGKIAIIGGSVEYTGAPYYAAATVVNMVFLRKFWSALAKNRMHTARIYFTNFPWAFFKSSKYDFLLNSEVSLGKKLHSLTINSPPLNENYKFPVKILQSSGRRLDLRDVRSGSGPDHQRIFAGFHCSPLARARIRYSGIAKRKNDDSNIWPQNLKLF